MAENRELALVLKLVADQFQRELRNSQSQLASFNNFIKDWKTQLAAAGTALFALAKSAANFGEEALKGAQKAGQTVEVFSALSHAAKMADLNQQQLILGLKSLSQNMVEASRGTGDGEAAFRRLGIAAVDANGKLRPTEQVLLDVADVFAKSADGAGKTEAAIKLFGKAGLELIPFLNQGRDGIQAMMEEAKRLGLVLSKEDAEAANKFNDEIKRLDAQVQGLALSVGSALIPMLTDLLKLLGEIGTTTKKAGEEMAGFSKHLSENFGKTGAGQGLMELFSAMGLGHRKGEAPGAMEQALVDALGIKPGGSGGGAGREVQLGASKPEIAQLRDQVALGKQIVEMGLLKWRTEEIGLRLKAEAAARDGAAEERRGRMIVEQAQLVETIRAREEQEEGARQQRRGRMIVESTQLEVELRERALAEQLKNSRTFFDEWRDGMKQYVQDTKSGLGLGADMARRTAQAMEQNFRTFFFDLFEGRIRSLQDVLKGVSNFIAQIASQIAAQFATRALIGAFGLTAAGGGMVQRFATGGPVLGVGNRDTVPALLTPGEFVLSRQDVGDIKRGLGSQVRVVVNNYSQSEVSASSRRGPDGTQELEIMVAKAVNRSITEGRMDKAMRSRFNLTPGER